MLNSIIYASLWPNLNNCQNMFHEISQKLKCQKYPLLKVFEMHLTAGPPFVQTIFQEQTEKHILLKNIVLRKNVCPIEHFPQKDDTPEKMSPLNLL